MLLSIPPPRSHADSAEGLRPPTHGSPGRCHDERVNERPNVTLRDVARLAAVSPSAASAALRGGGRLHPETRARILAAADELGYRRNALARSLRRSGNGVVVTVMHDMPSDESIRRPKSFWEQTLFGYVQELASAGTGNVFVPAQRSHLIAELPAEIVVVLNLPQGDRAQVVEVPDGIPTIRVVSATEAGPAENAAPVTALGGGTVGNFVWDYHAALGTVFTHLLEAGSQSPGLLLPPKPLMPTALIRQAQQDWCAAHDRAILRDESVDIAVGTRNLLDVGCDGFVVHGDDAAGDVDQVLATLRSAGARVPDDVLVASNLRRPTGVGTAAARHRAAVRRTGQRGADGPRSDRLAQHR